MSMEKISTNLSRAVLINTQSGFTLIEVLIATIIGLLGTIVIFTVYQNAEGFKRTTIAAGDAQTSGAVALYSIEQYIRTSGSGIATTNEAQLVGTTSRVQPNLLLGCPLTPNPNGAGVAPNTATTTTGVGAATPTRVAPVRIIDGSQLGGIAGASDVLVIMGGNADIATNPTAAGPLANPATAVTGASNLLGWRVAVTTPPAAVRPADIALMTQAGGTGNVSASNCSLNRILNVTSPSGSGTINLTQAVPAGANYTPRTNLHNVGPSPYFISIGVNARQELVETSFLPTLTREGAGATGVIQRVLADGIVNVQAQYGIDDNMDDVIDRWVEPTDAGYTAIWSAAPDATVAVPVASPLNPPAPNIAAINKIKAIRLAILARSQQYEAPDRTTLACNATPAAPVWQRLLPARAGADLSLVFPFSADILPAVIANAPAGATNWQCFRYRRFETIVPIINMARSPL
jgi:type IV pilus assembly protein PilW